MPSILRLIVLVRLDACQQLGLLSVGSRAHVKCTLFRHHVSCSAVRRHVKVRSGHHQHARKSSVRLGGSLLRKLLIIYLFVKSWSLGWLLELLGQGAGHLGVWLSGKHGLDELLRGASKTGVHGSVVLLDVDRRSWARNLECNIWVQQELAYHVIATLLLTIQYQLVGFKDGLQDHGVFRIQNYFWLRVPV